MGQKVMKTITKGGYVSWSRDSLSLLAGAPVGAPTVIDESGSSYWYIRRGEEHAGLLLMVPPRGKMGHSRITKLKAKVKGAD